MNVKNHILLVLCCELLSAGCAHKTTVAVLASSSFTQEELAVSEAVFRDLFEHNYSGMQKTAEAYCLSVIRDGSSLDPDRAFLVRFADVRKPIREGSRFRRGSDLLFRISALEKKGEGLFQVSAGYYEDTLSASSTVFDVRLQDGQWRVSKNPDAIELISKKANQSPESMAVLRTAMAHH